ncbi:hypothetical protein SCYAM73S_06152 [Streptomyces cyaneofuscatus]
MQRERDGGRPLRGDGQSGGPLGRLEPREVAARHRVEEGGEPGAPGRLRLELQVGEEAGAAGSGDVLQEGAEQGGQPLAVGGAGSGGELGGEREVLLQATLSPTARSTASRVGK